MRTDRPRRITPLLAVVLVGALFVVTALTVWAAGPGQRPTARPPAAAPSGAVAARGTPTSAAAPDHPRQLDRYYSQPVRWASCGDGTPHLCATIEVPVDYARPAGGVFRLALRKVPALDPARRIGSLVINPGGPGGSGVEYATYASFVFSERLRTVYDVIGFDPRGLGASDAVQCLSDDQMDLLFAADPTPDTPAERATLLDDVDRLTASCARSGGDRALHLGSAEVARDLDVIRALVGDARLNYFGVSYGTFLGALYADLFPARVGRLVLDSALSPNQTEAERLRNDIQGFESSMDAFLEWCTRRPACALGHDKAAATGRIVDLLDRVDTTGLATSTGGLSNIGEGWASFAIFMCLYSEASWPVLDKGLAEAIGSGRGDTLLGYAMQVVGRSATGDYDRSSYLQAMIPVRCADWPRTADPTALRAEQARLARDHPLWARIAGEPYETCRAWPTSGRQPSGRTLAPGAAPILVIGNLRDPATPIGGTRQLAKDLGSGVLVTADNDGHGTYFAGNSCIDDIVDDYLIEGTTPADGRAC